MGTRLCCESWLWPDTPHVRADHLQILWIRTLRKLRQIPGHDWFNASITVFEIIFAYAHAQ